MSSKEIIIASLEQWQSSAKNYINEDVDIGALLNEVKIRYEEYDIYENWEKWASWKKKNIKSMFQFSLRPTKDPHFFMAYIINTEEVIRTLQEYHDLFRKELKMEFDPKSAVLEFEDLSSIFWKKVLSNHYLCGILYGYGERNSYFFSYEMAHKNSFVKKSKPSPVNFHDVTMDNIKLPAFTSYSEAFEEDPITIKYKKERENIQAYLKDKNFLEEVLKKLSRN
jgi:hypothetical protein